MVVNDGYRFIQGLLPAKMHKDFTVLSRKLEQSRSELLRQAIEHFLKDSKSINTQCPGGNSNDRNC